MKKILFIRNDKAVLPEIDAYISYFNKINDYQAFDSSKLSSNYDINHYDIIWEFKGIGGIKSKEHIIVHEYASLSTGKFQIIKDRMKKIINPKPDLRIFLNKNVKQGFNFNDSISYSYRDMGITSNFITGENKNKEYDFVYVGEITKARGMDIFLREFAQKNPGKLCLIGTYEQELFDEYSTNKNIIFMGKVPYSQVAVIASKGIYGINYIPDKYPYNIQTSTKLLEYLAMDLKIITTDYKWIRQFEMEHDCNFYKIKENNINISLDKLDAFDFKIKFNAEDYLWENILQKTNILEQLNELIWS